VVFSAVSLSCVASRTLESRSRHFAILGLSYWVAPL
jgi:hypothetical protein